MHSSEVRPDLEDPCPDGHRLQSAVNLVLSTYRLRESGEDFGDGDNTRALSSSEILDTALATGERLRAE